MSYAHTVTIMSNINTAYITENISAVYEAIYSKIASITGWEASASGLLVGTGSKQLRINISYLSSNASNRFIYTIYSQNDNGNVYLDTSGMSNSSISSSTSNLSTLYLHYCKSKSGKTVAIGLTTSLTPVFHFIIAEDVNGDFSAIGLHSLVSSTSGTDWGALMVWNGYKCRLSNTKVGSYNYSALQPVVDASISTSVCKMPNFLSGVMFKELFMILSSSVNSSSLNSVVLDIEGKKYQGCYEYTVSDSNKEGGNALAILAG